MLSDARLQRPEYLGGARNPVVISEVLATVSQTATGEEAPQGNMSGHGVSVGSQNGFTRRFEEHGYVLGIMSVMPKTAYQQGLHRMWTREDKFEYFWPDFANLGEQEVLSKEIYFDPNDTTNANNDATFGYQSRYAEYKYSCDSVHGDFRDNLDFWHLGRKFTSRPTLNESFVQSDPSHRIFSVIDPTEDKLYCQVYNRVDALRPMPYFGTPKL